MQDSSYSKEIKTRDKNNQTYTVDMAWFISDLNIKEILLLGSSDLQWNPF